MNMVENAIHVNELHDQNGDPFPSVERTVLQNLRQQVAPLHFLLGA